MTKHPKKARDMRGERNPYRKLTEEQADAILHGILPCNATARLFRVSHVTVSQIRSGKRWPHLSAEKRTGNEHQGE
jgi:hypothetical protein